jgi:hypothetical protein
VVAAHDSLHTATDIKEALTNFESGVCQQPGRFTPGMYTFMSIVGDSKEKRVWINVSPATGGQFTEVAFR